MQPFVNPNYFQQTTQMPQMNYGYNPYQRIPQIPAQDISLPGAISGRMVQSVDQITADDVPMNGSVAFFPKQDMSEIYAKSWGADGIIRTIVFKPYENDDANNLSHKEEKLKVDLSDEATDLFMNKFDELSEKIEQLESRFDKSLGSQKKSSRTQSKDGDSE